MAGIFFKENGQFDLGGPWWIAVFILAVALIIWARKKQKRDFIAGRAEFARQSGFQVVNRKSPFTRANAPALHLFTQGRSHHFSYSLEGSVGGQYLLVFDYSYIYGLHAQKTFAQTVTAFPIPAGYLPPFELYSSTALDRVGAQLGMKTIDIPDSDLSKRYLFRSVEPSAVRVLTPSLINELKMRKHGWWVESSGAWLLVYRRDRTFVDSASLLDFTQEAAGIARTLLPAPSSNL
jgi:hypothetical protein